ncbi:Clp protease N-terminal domain-containing protein [Marinactinospora thermotolerans]|uniref:Clp amino terminal domain-containing protein, pathogenicity island component n=1 Tax=Marinactinospora thermotolerans DSM 45154 TaxID=1122192 RepID=A0A1T4T1T2_9ACTN|nr:Clp protease N-terminal domain-containing protein [Marinactinospora thermotolerans]SKA34357.1 Clp amino terminal domain-containing protein, pathogenicity island component [Marinactinospora thermotolerans DSM 45154]
MFERFRIDARQAVKLAQDESRHAGHHHIGSEHLLLGLLAQEESTAARLLHDNGADIHRLRRQVAALPSTPPRGPLARLSRGRHRPFTTEAKKTLERSLRIALAHRHRHIGGGHILLASLEDPAVARSLTDIGVDATAVRAAAERLLDV